MTRRKSSQDDEVPEFFVQDSVTQGRSRTLGERLSSRWWFWSLHIRGTVLGLWVKLTAPLTRKLVQMNAKYDAERYPPPPPGMRIDPPLRFYPSLWEELRYWASKDFGRKPALTAEEVQRQREAKADLLRRVYEHRRMRQQRRSGASETNEGE